MIRIEDTKNFHKLLHTYIAVNNSEFKSKTTHNNIKLHFREEILSSNEDIRAKIFYTYSESYLDFIKKNGYKFTNSTNINKKDFFLWIKYVQNKKTLNKSYKEDVWEIMSNSKFFNIVDNETLSLITTKHLFDEKTIKTSLSVEVVPKLKDKLGENRMIDTMIEFIYSKPDLMLKYETKSVTQTDIATILNISQEAVSKRMKSKRKVYKFIEINSDEKDTILINKNQRIFQANHLGYNLKEIMTTGEVKANDSRWFKLVGTTIVTNLKFKFRKLGKHGNFKLVDTSVLKRSLKNKDASNELNVKAEKYKFSNTSINDKVKSCNKVVLVNKNDQTSEFNKSTYSKVAYNLNDAIRKLKAVIQHDEFKNQIRNILPTSNRDNYDNRNLLRSAGFSLTTLCKHYVDHFICAYAYKNFEILKGQISEEIEKYRTYLKELGIDIEELTDDERLMKLVKELNKRIESDVKYFTKDRRK